MPSFQGILTSGKSLWTDPAEATEAIVAWGSPGDEALQLVTLTIWFYQRTANMDGRSARLLRPSMITATTSVAELRLDDLVMFEAMLSLEDKTGALLTNEVESGEIKTVGEIVECVRRAGVK